MKLHYGKTCKKIAETLNREHIITPSLYAISHGQKVSNLSSIWSAARIREILLNEVYIGNMVQGRMKKVSYKSKKNIRLPKQEWKIVENTHEPIIDKKTFKKVQNLIYSRKKTRVRSNDYLLKGLVYCHECGKKMYCSSQHLKDGSKYYFRCSTHISKSGCYPHSIRMDYVENFVQNLLNTYIDKYFSPEKLDNLTKQIIDTKVLKPNDFQKNREFYTNLLKNISNEIDALYNDKLYGLIELDDFNRIYKTKISKKKLIVQKIKTQDLCTTDYNISQLINLLINDFKSSFKINRSVLVSLISKIEIDCSKKVYIFFNFRDTIL